MNATQPRTTLHADSEPATDCPLVSVIIPYYNGGDYIDQAVRSALAQTYTNLQVIIVNDGSPDGSGEQLDKRYENEPRVTVLHQENAGTAAARNTGIRHANGSLIALLDQDDRWLPHKLERQVPLFDDSKVGLVHSGGRVTDRDTQQVTSTYHAAEVLTTTELMRWCKIGCATTVIRRSSLDQVGLFNPDLGGVDDWDMWVRLAGAGFKVRGVHEPLVEIFEHPDNQGKGFEKLYPRAKIVIQSPRDFDQGQPEYRAARAAAMHRLRQDFYVKACRQATSAWSRGNLIEAIRFRLKAFYYYPEGITHPIKRLFAAASAPVSAEKAKGSS